MECLSWEPHTGSEIGSVVSDTFLWLILPFRFLFLRWNTPSSLRVDIRDRTGKHVIGNNQWLEL